jgi:hypothetical protein
MRLPSWGAGLLALPAGFAHEEKELEKNRSPQRAPPIFSSLNFP